MTVLKYQEDWTQQDRVGVLDRNRQNDGVFCSILSTNVHELVNFSTLTYNFQNLHIISSCVRRLLKTLFGINLGKSYNKETVSNSNETMETQ